MADSWKTRKETGPQAYDAKNRRYSAPDIPPGLMEEVQQIVAEVAAGMTPAGVLIDARDTAAAAKAIKNKDPGGIPLGVLTAAGWLPIGGDFVKSIGKRALDWKRSRAARKALGSPDLAPPRDDLLDELIELELLDADYSKRPDLAPPMKMKTGDDLLKRIDLGPDEMLIPTRKGRIRSNLSRNADESPAEYSKRMKVDREAVIKKYEDEKNRPQYRSESAADPNWGATEAWEMAAKLAEKGRK